MANIKLSCRLINTRPLTQYSDHKGYHVSHVQSDSKLVNVVRQRSITVGLLVATVWTAPETDFKCTRLCSIVGLQNAKFARY